MAGRTRVTQPRAKYASMPVPERPFFIEERNWSMFAAHVWEGRSFQQISASMGLSRQRVRLIVAGVAHDFGLPRDDRSTLTPNSPIEDLSLSMRARNALLELGCRTIADLLGLDLTVPVRRLGPRTRAEVAEALARRGFVHSALAQPKDADIARLTRTLHQLKTRIGSAMRGWQEEVEGIESRLRRLRERNHR